MKYSCQARCTSFRDSLSTYVLVNQMMLLAWFCRLGVHVHHHHPSLHHQPTVSKHFLCQKHRYLHVLQNSHSLILNERCCLCTIDIPKTKFTKKNIHTTRASVPKHGAGMSGPSSSNSRAFGTSSKVGVHIPTGSRRYQSQNLQHFRFGAWKWMLLSVHRWHFQC